MAVSPARCANKCEVSDESIGPIWADATVVTSAPRACTARTSRGGTACPETMSDRPSRPSNRRWAGPGGTPGGRQVDRNLTHRPSLSRNGRPLAIRRPRRPSGHLPMRDQTRITFVAVQDRYAAFAATATERPPSDPSPWVILARLRTFASALPQSIDIVYVLVAAQREGDLPTTRRAAGITDPRSAPASRAGRSDRLHGPQADRYTAPDREARRRTRMARARSTSFVRE
jgi:hypothetical protein